MPRSIGVEESREADMQKVFGLNLECSSAQLLQELHPQHRNLLKGQTASRSATPHFIPLSNKLHQ